MLSLFDDLIWWLRVLSKPSPNGELFKKKGLLTNPDVVELDRPTKT
jgi:hypothetical protein